MHQDEKQNTVSLHCYSAILKNHATTKTGMDEHTTFLNVSIFESFLDWPTLFTCKIRNKRLTERDVSLISTLQWHRVESIRVRKNTRNAWKWFLKVINNSSRLKQRKSGYPVLRWLDRIFESRYRSTLSD